MNEANELIDDDIEVDIQGYDADGSVIKIARRNAREAGVDHLIHFQERDVKDLSHPKKYGFIITNPPYGERLEDKKDLPALYKTFGESFKNLDSWSAYMITSYEDAERYFGRKADSNRKIYNGMLKTYFYQFLGPKPPANCRGDGEKTRWKQLIFATGNQHKMLEIREDAQYLGAEILSHERSGDKADVVEDRNNF